MLCFIRFNIIIFLCVLEDLPFSLEGDFSEEAFSACAHVDCYQFALVYLLSTVNFMSYLCLLIHVICIIFRNGRRVVNVGNTNVVDSK